MCLAGLDMALGEDQVAHACGCSPLGTSYEDALAALTAFGCSGDLWTTADLDRLTNHLALGGPAIIAQLTGISHGRPVRHAVVVTGWDGHHILYHDPASGKEERLTADRFLARWQAAGGTGLIIWRT
jgi:ABC-type bacteriocin/lantibiotic exporter with double-glycine peptidase domain